MKKPTGVMKIAAVAVGSICLLPAMLCAKPGLLEQSGLGGGLVVALDFGDGEPIAELASEGKFIVHCLLTDEADVEKAREAIRQEGVYGQVSCDRYNGRDLPYIDDLVNVVIRSSSCKAPEEELMRVIAPLGQLVTQKGEGWEKTVKPRPEGVDEWRQFLHGADNNGVSLDDVGPPQRLRWHAVPDFGRSKALSPSVTSMVSAYGTVFTIEDRATTEDVNAPVEYYLVARDAFNGIELWKRPMKQWGKWQTNSIKSIPTQQQRSLVAIGRRVYCCMEFGGPITVFEPRTGVEKRVLNHTDGTAEFVVEGPVLYGIRGNPYRIGKGSGPAGSVELYALTVQQGTGVLWRKDIDSEYTGGTMVVKGNRVVYHSKSGLTCLDAASGKTLWTEAIAVPKAKGPLKASKGKRKAPAPALSAFTGNDHPTIVITDDVVYCGIGSSVTAKSLADGKTLWATTGGVNYKKSPDLFVADGLVWGRDLKGRDPKTGKVVRSLTQLINGPMSHDRCYRNRVTHRYYLNSATGGTDFMELDGTSESPNPWARSTCGLAVMPANGMIYNGPYVCQCAIGAMVTGFNAMYNGSGNTDKRFTVALQPRLVKGSAFGMSPVSAATAADWPTYRGSAMRSAVSTGPAPRGLSQAWKVDIGSHPTAPVVVGNSVYVADRDAYTLYALNRETGEARWTFTAGGRIDSPPTYYKGLVLFGCRCGSVYCLRAEDGELVWRFNGMPERRLICDKGRLESAWPVNGGIMIYEDTAYFAAGRSSFLDGGIGVFGLDPLTGRMKHGRMMQGPYQDNNRNFPVQASGTFQLEGFKSGIFSTAEDTLFIRHQAFKPDLTPIKLDDVKTLHLMASPGFLNDAPQHRTYWTVDRNLRYGGSTGSFGAGPAGDTIAYDGKSFFEVRGYAPGRNLPGRGKGMDAREIYSIFSGGLRSRSGAERRSAIPAFGDWEEHWNTPIPFAGHAIAVSGNTVLAAGVPMLKDYSPEDTNASYAGKKGGLAWLLDSENGRKLQELRLDAAPVWDGIAIAHAHYFICLKDGSVVCLAGE